MGEGGKGVRGREGGGRGDGGRGGGVGGSQGLQKAIFVQFIFVHTGQLIRIKSNVESEQFIFNIWILL